MRLTAEERASFRAYAEANRQESNGDQCQWADYTLRLLDEVEAAAAPTLLEALEQIIVHADRCDLGTTIPELAEAAIARAKGESA